MIALRLLGPVEVTVDGAAPPPELLWRKHLALLVYLARSPRRVREREHLVGLLWGDKPEGAARHSLREAIRVLRQAGGESLLDADGDQVRLADGLVTSDIETFDAHAGRAELAAAADLAQGDFLEGFGIADAPAFEDWLTVERQSVRARLVEVLVKRAEQLEQAGNVAASIACARRALALEPVSAAAARALIKALALNGERAAALAAADTFANTLRSQVGTEPDDQTRRLVEQVRRERVRRVQPAPSEPGSRRAPLLGRDSLEFLLGGWWNAQRGRCIVTMVEGPPGVGRTRVLEEVAARARLAGAAVVELRGVPGDRDTAWSGVLALARGGLLDAAGTAGAPAEALAAFATRLEDWGDRFPAARKLAPKAAGAALVDAVRAAATEQPVALVVDDAQWLDAESLRALHGLARDLARSPVLLILAATPEPAREELDRLRAQLGRDIPGGPVRLEPLSPADLRALTRWAVPDWSDIDVDRLARRLAADSAGLPLLAVELLHAVTLGMDLHGTARAWPEPQRTLDQTLPGDLPEAIVAAVRMGFRRLGKDAQTALGAVAVLDGRAAGDQIARATGLGSDALAAALDEAEWQRWLVVDARGYSFVARLIGQIVARDMVTEGNRRRILERVTPQ